MKSSNFLHLSLLVLDIPPSSLSSLPPNPLNGYFNKTVATFFTPLLFRNSNVQAWVKPCVEMRKIGKEG